MCILEVWCYWCRARRDIFPSKNTPLFLKHRLLMFCVLYTKICYFPLKSWELPPACPQGLFPQQKYTFIFLKHRILIFCVLDTKICYFPSKRVGSSPQRARKGFFPQKVDIIFKNHIIFDFVS